MAIKRSSESLVVLSEILIAGKNGIARQSRIDASREQEGVTCANERENRALDDNQSRREH